MPNLIKFKQGLKSSLPILTSGEPAFVTDLQEVFIGTGSSNIRLLTQDDISTTVASQSHTTLTTTAHGGIVSSTDSRLSDSRTPNAHVLNSASHTVSGLTTGHFIKATSATTFGFAAHGLTHSDVGAAASSHSHLIADLPVASSGTSNTTQVVRADDSRLSDSRTPNNHNLIDTTKHPVTGLTAGHYIRAASSTTYSFSAIQASDIPTLNQNTTGSASTLTTTRTIWGNNFNGSQNVSGNLTSVGNITGSSAIIISSGGTNQDITLSPSGTGSVIINGIISGTVDGGEIV